MDKVELSNILQRIGDNFNVPISGGYVDIMSRMFDSKKITVDQVRKAAYKIIDTKMDLFGRMPNFAEFKEFIEGDPDQAAEIEANNVVKQIRDLGADGKPKLSIPMVNAINIRFGGWQNMCCGVEESKLQWFIRDLKEAYLIELAKEDRLMLPDKQEAGKVLNMIEGRGEVLKTMTGSLQ
jgi:hypothetical protein